MVTAGTCATATALSFSDFEVQKFTGAPLVAVMKWRESQPPIWDELAAANSAIQVRLKFVLFEPVPLIASEKIVFELFLFLLLLISFFASECALRVQRHVTRALASSRLAVEPCAIPSNGLATFANSFQNPFLFRLRISVIHAHTHTCDETFIRPTLAHRRSATSYPSLLRDHVRCCARLGWLPVCQSSLICRPS